jgi:hypothetical protein
VTLRILKPIETTQLSLKDRGALTAQIRTLIVNELQQRTERAEPEKG